MIIPIIIAIIIDSPKCIAVWIILFPCEMNDESENRGNGEVGK